MAESAGRYRAEAQAAIVWLRARSFSACSNPRAATGEVRQAVYDISRDARTRVIERRREAQGEARLEEARVIVSGGRGIGGPNRLRWS